MKKIEKIISQQKESLNIHQYAFIKSDQVIFSHEVRRLCEENACGMYGKSWACPPAVGSVKHCKRKCSEFENALIFTSLNKLKSMANIQDAWLGARKVHEAITENVDMIFHTEFEKIMTLSTEGCTICEKCTYPEKPCRFPDSMFPATEGLGILVIQQALACGIKYNNGPNTLTYFSMIFF